MFNTPGRGSPGCVLVIASLFLGLLGFLFAYMGSYGLLRAKGETLENVLMIGGGVVLISIAVVLAVSGFKKPESPHSLFSPDRNPMERALRAKTEAERELAERAAAETSRKANQLTIKERQVLDEIKASILTAPSHDEIIRTLGEKGGGEVVLANSALQLVAFAIKPTTTLGYLKGLGLEVLAWAGVALAIPLILASDVWHSGRMVLSRALRWSRRARQYRVRPHNLFRRDPRAPILYLRSFSDEDYAGSPEGVLPTTSEEKLVNSYNRSGPVVAIGKPKEDLPLLGASRVYFDDSTWQAGVLYLMSVSQLVIIQAGIAPGLLWELGCARRQLGPQKLLVSFTAWEDLDEWTRHLHYLRFKKYAEELLGCELPPDIKTISHLTFGEGWAPKPQSDLSYSIPSVKERRGRVKRLAGGAMAVASALLAVSLAPWVVRQAVELTGANTYTEESARWQQHTLGSTGLTVDLPAAPSPVDARNIILAELSVFEYEGGDLSALMGHTLASPLYVVKGEETLRNLADGLRQEEGNGEVRYTTRQVGEGKFALDGTFVKYGKSYAVRGYSWAKDRRLWFVRVSYYSGNNAAVLAAQRILDSVKISGF